MPVAARPKKLLIIGTHPIQYLAPVYRMLEEKWNVPVQIIYASDFSVVGYFDKAFRTHVAWDVDLFTQPDRCTFLSRANNGGATCFDEISAKGLGKALDKFSPAAVMLTGYSPSFHMHAFWQVFRRRYPILFRAETINRSPSNRTRWMRNLMLRALYSRCKRLLPIGKRSYQHYREFGCPDDKLVLSPYCVDTAPFECDEEARAKPRPATRAALGISEDKTVILFSGKLGEHKRPGLLIEAVKLLPKAERDRVALLFLGSGPDQEALAAHAAKAPAVPAHFPGFKNQTELSPYYHAADLLALPSRFETWGLVVNEALHHGIPCLVTDTVGSAADLVYPGITGEISSGTADSVTAALVRALALARRAEVRASCRSVIAEYTVEKASKGICDAFRQVVELV